MKEKANISSKLEKIVALLLYSVPILFFVICYFVIITSGEDIWQGAKSQVDIIGDAIAAFNHSVRLADMFAWSVINFFDYNFSFGPDIVFRLLDVIVAFSIFYMSTYIALKRLPKLKIFDAAVFALIFLAVFLTSNGLTLYAGFSKIHNYLFISFFSLAFLIVYIKDLWGHKISKSFWFRIFMLVLGFVFGFASNVTAIVFLLALLCYLVYRYLCMRKSQLPQFKEDIKSFFLSWRFAGVIGILVSLWLMFFVGNGLGDYDTNPAYLTVCDYVPLAEIFKNPGNSFVRIVWHNIYNFGRFLLPFIVAFIPIVIYSLACHVKPNFSFIKKNKKYLVAIAMFVFMHVFAMSQIIYPTRLMLPAYLVAVPVFICTIWNVFFAQRKSKNTARKSLIMASVLLILMTVVTVIRGYFAFTYVSRITPILEDIKTTKNDEYCVDIETATAESLPYIHLGQEDFLVDWAMPQTIYGKKVSYCN